MKKIVNIFALLLMSVFHTSCGQNQTNSPKENINSETKDSVSSYGPTGMVRNEDKKGNIWFGDIDGLWRYDVSTYTRASQKGAYAIIENKKGNIWRITNSICL